MPHPYITDSDERKNVTFLLAVLAIAVALLTSSLLKVMTIEIPTWVDGPSTLTLFGLFYAAFKRWLWRVRLLHRIGLVKVPYINGRWNGFIVTSYDNRDGKREVDVVIVQDWTDMLVTLQGQHSKSKSCVASLLVRDGIELAYEYASEPLADAVETMHTHRGYARLDLSFDRLTLDGEYFSGRDRQNIGTIHLRRVMQ